MEIYKRLLIYLTPYKARLAWSVVFMGLTSALSQLQAYLVKPVLDNVILAKNMELGLLLPPALMLVTILKGAAAYARDYLHGLGGTEDRERHSRSALFAYRHPSPFPISHRTPTGVIISRIINDVNLVQGALTKAPSSLVQGVFTMVGTHGICHLSKLAACRFFHHRPAARRHRALEVQQAVQEGQYEMQEAVRRPHDAPSRDHRRDPHRQGFRHGKVREQAVLRKEQGPVQFAHARDQDQCDLASRSWK